MRRTILLYFIHIHKAFNCVILIVVCLMKEIYLFSEALDLWLVGSRRHRNEGLCLLNTLISSTRETGAPLRLRLWMLSILSITSRMLFDLLIILFILEPEIPLSAMTKYLTCCVLTNNFVLILICVKLNSDIHLL